MRVTLPRLVRVIPRSQVDPSFRPLPQPNPTHVPRPTLIQILQKRRQEAGDSFPENIRIEPTKSEMRPEMQGLPSQAKKTLVTMIKEH